MAFDFPIHELNDSPQVDLARDSIRGVRRFLIPDANQFDFAVGMTAVSTGYGMGPAAFPRFTAARVERIHFEPFSHKPDSRTITDPTTQYNTFTGDSTHGPCTCLAVVYYSASAQNMQTSDPRDDGLPEGTWATYQQRASGEFMSVPGRALYWPSDNKSVGQDAKGTIYIPLADHVITWHRVSSPPWDVISEMKGQVNSGNFRLPGSGQMREAKTLLFESSEASTEFKFDPSQPQLWTLSYTLREKRIKCFQSGVPTIVGWNHLFNENSGAWEEPKCRVTDKFFHYTGDFARLFRFA